MTTALVVVTIALIGLAVFDRIVVAQKVMGLVRETNATHQGTVQALLDHMAAQEASFRAERERLQRVIIAKNTGELAALERIETAQRKVEASRDTRQMTEADFQRWLSDDLERMGEDPRRVFGDGVPATPEGL